MKILHINKFDTLGGAARSAYRLHRSLIEFNITSTFFADRKNSDDWTVDSHTSNFSRVLCIVKPQISSYLSIFDNEEKSFKSYAVFPSSLVNIINNSDCDIVNLHWIGLEMLSISDIAKINKPIVWTFHDMWPFSGAKHITFPTQNLLKNNNSSLLNHLIKFDLDKWVLNRKRKYWTKKFNIVSPSLWLYNNIKKSDLFQSYPVTIIPNPIDVNFWKPIDMVFSRKQFNLALDKKIILFGAMGGASDPNKGFDLLSSALKHLKLLWPGCELVVFGQSKPKVDFNFNFPVHYLGRLNDDVSLRLIYSAADVMVVPSRIENLPNTAIESMCCGTPVVGFNNSGLLDIVDHLRDGYLAKAFDTFDLANGIAHVIGENSKLLSESARKSAVKNFSHHIIAMKYIELYRHILIPNTDIS